MRIPCVSPGQLRDYLERYDGGAFTDLVYHAGNHVAALWQERPPVGQFGPEDLLVHHLGGLPETLTRAEFERRFPRPKYDTLVWKRQPMLLAAVGNPSFSSGGVKAVLPEAEVILAHLEGAVDAGRPAPSPQLAEPGQVKKVLHGVDCVSLAAYFRDAEDLPGLADMCRELDEAGIRYVGVGRDPVVIEKKGVRLALWGVLDTVPDNMEEWREKVDQLIVLVHWDGERSRRPTRRQRELARRLAAGGADLVLGSQARAWQQPWNEGLTRVYPSLGSWRMDSDASLPASSRRSGVLIPLGPERRRGMERVEMLPVDQNPELCK